MKKIKLVSSKSLLKKQMASKEFKKEFKNLKEEFEVAREMRLDAKLTQKELAKLAGTSQPAIARLESGNYKNLSLTFLNRVGLALGAIPEIHFRKTKFASR
jgi:predicted transcriptional regulator